MTERLNWLVCSKRENWLVWGENPRIWCQSARSKNSSLHNSAKWLKLSDPLRMRDFMVCKFYLDNVVKTGFPGGSAVKNLPASARDVGSIPGWGRSPGVGNGNPLQYSCLGNSMDREAWWATWGRRVWHDLVTKQQQSCWKRETYKKNRHVNEMWYTLSQVHCSTTQLPGWARV